MGMLDRYRKELYADSPEGKKKQIRLNTAVFAITIGIITIIGAFIIPVLYNIDLFLLQTEIIVSCVLGVLFIASGALFIKFDHIAVIIVMLLLFLGFVGDKIYSVATGNLLAGNGFIYFGLILGILQILTICSYLALHFKKTVIAPEKVAEIIREVHNLTHKADESADTVNRETDNTVLCQTCGLKNNGDVQYCTGCKAQLKK